MLQIELINTDNKRMGGVIAIIDFSNPDEVKTVIKSILDLHKSMMSGIKKSEKALNMIEVVSEIS